MIIAHICVSNFYVENMAYQENILPRMHKLDGHTPVIITTPYCFDAKGNKFEREIGKYINDNGIEVIVLPYDSKNLDFSRKYRKVSGLYETLVDIKPDIIFSHGTTYASNVDVIKYKKENPDVKVYGDHHGDYYNCGMVGVSKIKALRHRYVYRYTWGRMARKYVKISERVWGVTPWRKQFLEDVFMLSPKKTGLLVMGGEDDKIHTEKREEFRKILFEKYSINDDDFLIVTGGKIDKAKNFHLLAKAVTQMKQGKIHLVVFGSETDDVKPLFDEFRNCPNIHLIGWIDSSKAYDWFVASDLGVFPGTHSVLWEQAVACGLPCIFCSWDGMHHVDLDGNCLFVDNGNYEQLKDTVVKVYEDKALYNKMKKISAEKGMQEFSYRAIARRAIFDNSHEDERDN